MANQSYELIPTTDREADVVAAKHGFENIAALAASLPEDARVLDVGAGASPFGKEVAQLRPDITWINFDYSYGNSDILDEVSKDAPENIQYIAGDATQLVNQFEPESFDAVFSYWMIPHLSIDDPQPAKEAAQAMFTVAKQDAPISIGPLSKGPVPSLRNLFVQGKAERTIKDESTDAENYADNIVAKTKLPRLGQITQKTANEVITPLLGTSRWATYQGRLPKIYHKESGEYVSPLTVSGIKTIGRLAVAMTFHAARQTRRRT